MSDDDPRQAASTPRVDDLKTAPAVLRATIHITRKATGKVDTFELVGVADCRDDSVTPTTTAR